MKINFDIIIDYIKNNIQINKQLDDYYNIWKNKLDYLEKYFIDNYIDNNYDFFFYKGLAEISLRLINNVDHNYCIYGPSINRFYYIKDKYDLYNSSFVKFGPVVNTISEYLKYDFFYNNREVEYEKIFDLSLNKSDYYFLVAKLLYPTYYFDLLKDNKIMDEYEIIVNKIDDYLLFVKRIIISIKKRHNDMPFIDYIINLL